MTEIANNQKTETRNCFVYQRVSTQEQAESQLGLKAQRESCRQYARNNNLQIRRYFVDEGISGTKGVDHRPALAQMLKALSPGTVVLVASRNRLSRDTYLNLWLEKECKKVHAVIESASGEGNGDDPASEMMRRIVDAFSEYERNVIRVRTKAALAQSEKVLGKTSYGWMRNDQHQLVKSPDEYAVWEQIIDMRNTGAGWSAIARDLNEKKIKSRTGRKWSPTVVMRICRREEANRLREAMQDEQNQTNNELKEWEEQD